MTFAEGEETLNGWMAENAYVSWLVRSRPWELEGYLITALDLPLNLKRNSRNQFYPVLKAARARCRVQARALSALNSKLPPHEAGARFALSSEAE